MTEKDAKDLLFTQIRKVQVGPPVDCSSRRVSLLVVSNKYGLTIVGCNDGLRVFKTAVLNDIANNDEFKKTGAPASVLKAATVQLPSPPLILSLSSNETMLSVCLSNCVSPKAAFTVFIYNIAQLAQGKANPLCAFEPQKTATDHVTVVGAQWNPSNVPSLLALCLSSGDVLLVDVIDSSVRVTRSSSIGATSLCWSPKGKQLAVGLKNGRVAQLGQDLSKKKEFDFPDNIFSEKQQVANLFWISTREFAVMYSPLDAPSAGSGLPPITTCVVLLTANGSPGPKYINFDDVHYGTGFNAYNFLFNFIPNWKLLMIGSSSAIEVAVLSQTDDEWEKWNLEGTARPEVPLHSATSDECYVAGMALNFTSTAPVQLSDEVTLPPCPLLLIYSTEGILMPFTIVNTSCSPDKIKELSIHPEPLPALPQTTSPTQPIARGLAMSPTNTATSVASMSTQPHSVPPQTTFQPPRPGPPQTALAMSKPATQGMLTSLRPTNPASAPGVSISGSTAPSPFAGGNLGFSVSSFLSKPSMGAAPPASQPAAAIQAGKPSIASPTINAQSPLSLLPKVTPQPASSLNPALLKSPIEGGGGLALSLSTIQKPQDTKTTTANPLPQTSPITTLPLSSTPLTQQPSLQQPQRTSQQQMQQQSIQQQQQIQQRMQQQQQMQQQMQLRMIQQQQQLQHSQQQMQLQLRQQQQQAQHQQSSAHSVPAVSKPVTTNSPTTIPAKPPPTTSAAPATQQQARPTAAATAAASPSHVQEKFDASFINLIEQEIEKFVTDMNELTEDAVDKLNLPQDAEEERMMMIPQLGSMEDAMDTLVKGLDDLKDITMKIVDQTKELEGRVGAVGDKVLKGFELSEESRIRLQKTTDSKHLMLLRLQPLDPHNTRRLNDIRNHFTQLEQKLREVNCQLDAELECRHESIRQFGRSPMKPPPLQTVYSTLRNHRQITRVQRKSVEQLTDKMKSLQLLPRLWQPEHSCDLPVQSPPRSVSFTTTGYRSMMEPPSPEDTERQREKNKKLREQLLRIQRPTEILVPQGPPMMTYSLLPAASSFSPSLVSSPEPGSSILPPPPPPPSSLSLQQSLSLSKIQPPPQTSAILSSLTQPLPPPPASSLLTRVSDTASQPPSLSSVRPQIQPPSASSLTQPPSSIVQPLSASQPPSSLTQPPSLIVRPGSQPISQPIVRPPGSQPLSQQIVRLPGSQPLSQPMVRLPGSQPLSQPMVRLPGSQPLSQPVVQPPGSQPLSQPMVRPPGSQPSFSSFPRPPPPTSQHLTTGKLPVYQPPVGILPATRPSTASPLGISLTTAGTAPNKDHTAAILTSKELHIPRGDQSLVFKLSQGNIGTSAVSPSGVTSSGPTFSLGTSLPPTSSLLLSTPSPSTTPSTSPPSSPPPSDPPSAPSPSSSVALPSAPPAPPLSAAPTPGLVPFQGPRMPYYPLGVHPPPSVATATKPAQSSPLPSYGSLQNTPFLQNVPRPPPYSPMQSAAAVGSVGKNDTSKPPLPTTCTSSEVLPSSSTPSHSASPNVVITKSDVPLSQRLAQPLSSGQSLPASLTMMLQTAPKPSTSLTQSITSTTTTASLFSSLPGTSPSVTGPFVFGSNPTGGPRVPFSFTSFPSSTSQLLSNADSKKDGSSSALPLTAGKNPSTTKPTVNNSVTTVQVPTTVTSTVTPTTASPTGMITPPQDKPKNSDGVEDKTGHKESTPTSSDLPKLTASLSTIHNSGENTLQSNKPSSSSELLMQDEKPLLTSTASQPSVTKTTESGTATSNTVDAAKAMLSLTAPQSTGSDEEMENESDEHDVPGTGAQGGGGGGIFGLGKGGLGGLGLGGPSPMTGTSTANPFGSTAPVSAASLPTIGSSSSSSLFQAPRVPLMSSNSLPASSSTGLLGVAGFGASPMFGSGASPMFGSLAGLGQQRPPQVSMSNRLLFSGSNGGGAAGGGSGLGSGLFTNQQSSSSFSALASNAAGSTGFGQLAAGNSQPFTGQGMSGSQFQSYR